MRRRFVANVSRRQFQTEGVEGGGVEDLEDEEWLLNGERRACSSDRRLTLQWLG
jgi:hypothetical protein